MKASRNMNNLEFGILTNGWEITTLGKLGKFSKGKGISKSQLCHKGIPCIRYGEIYTSHHFIIKEFYSHIPPDVARESKRIQKNDILFAGSGETHEEIGKAVAFLSSEEVYAGGDIIIFSPNKDIVSAWLSYFLNSDVISKLKRKLGQGYSVIHIYSKDIATFKIPMVPYNEQKKIAAILSTWDKAIETTEKLIEAKRRLKKGLMQKLLTGRVRFSKFIKSNKLANQKFFDLPLDWDFVEINEIADQVSEKSKGKITPVLSCTKYNGLVDSLAYFNRQVFSKDTSNYKIVRKGDFAYATNHLEEGSIGYQDLCDLAVISPMYTVFKTNERIDDRFLFSVFKTQIYQHIFRINTTASVNRRGGLRWTKFSKIRIPLPSIKEQQGIASVLCAADQEIEILSKKLDILKLQKKGLMQKLLTGKIRVKI